MKNSLYNLFVPSGSDEYILYNFLHGSILTIDRELKKIIERQEFEKMNDPAIVETLKRCGVIVDDDADERRVYLYKYNREKFFPEYSLFIILVTFACNLSCPYCYEGAGKVMNKSMDEKTVLRTLNFIKKKSFEDNTGEVVLKLYGGEPLLNPQSCYVLLSELRAWGNETGIKVNTILQSNGTLLKKDLINSLSPYVTAVEITLDGPSEKHSQSRCYKKGGNSYEDIMENVRLLVYSGVNTVLRLNVDSPQELALLLDDFGSRGLKGSPYLSFYTAQISEYGLCEFFADDDLCLRDESRALEMIPQLRMVIREKQWQDNYHFYNTVRQQKLVACNNEKSGRYVIDPAGNIYKCIFWAGHDEYRVGALGDAGEEWNPGYHEILARNPMEFKECRACEYLPSCGGGCAMRAFIRNKTYRSSYCGSVKKMANKRILLYLKEKYPGRFSGC